MDHGATIVRSFELVESVWTQVRDLADSLARMTDAAITGGKLAGYRSAGGVSMPRDLVMSGISRKGYAVSLPITTSKRGKAVPTAWISYQIHLFGSGVPPRGNAGGDSIGPVLHVSFWEMATDFSDPALYVDFPPGWSDYPIKASRLLYWDAESTGTFAQWTFSVRLLDLDSEATLRASIITPLCALINGAAATDATVVAALPDTLRGLVFYANEDGDDAGPGLVAIDQAGPDPSTANGVPDSPLSSW